MPSTEDDLKRLGIGKKIQTFREQKDIGTEALADSVNITPALLSQIERDVVPPTLATLINISKALGVAIDTFFVYQGQVDKIELTREHERLTVPRTRESNRARLTYHYHALAYRLKDKQMEPFLVEFDATTEEALEPLSHGGEEFCYCLEGEIEFITDEQKLRLRPGDALYFFSDVPHVVRGVGPGTPRALFVLLPERERSSAGGRAK